MGPTFVRHVDVGILDSPMGPLGLPGLISQFTLFNIYIYIDTSNIHFTNKLIRIDM